MPQRFERLPIAEVLGHRVPVATTLAARTLGLAWLDPENAGPGLWLPSCRSVHTFGMRFALHVHFVDAGGRLLRILPAVPPRRLVWLRGAAGVLELPSR